MAQPGIAGVKNLDEQDNASHLPAGGKCLRSRPATVSAEYSGAVRDIFVARHHIMM
jgi:hypothetical protein